MTLRNRTTIPTRVGQYLAATALMAGLAIGAGAVANAVPNTGEWDIGAYDECVARGTNKRLCCSQSGGVWTNASDNPPNTCVAPSAQTQGTSPPVAGPPPVVATQPPPPPPVRNPGVVTETFTPAPASPG